MESILQKLNEDSLFDFRWNGVVENQAAFFKLLVKFHELEYKYHKISDQRVKERIIIPNIVAIYDILKEKFINSINFWVKYHTREIDNLKKRTDVESAAEAQRSFELILKRSNIVLQHLENAKKVEEMQIAVTAALNLQHGDFANIIYGDGKRRDTDPLLTRWGEDNNTGLLSIHQYDALSSLPTGIWDNELRQDYLD